jgi:hypothetical protein
MPVHCADLSRNHEFLVCGCSKVFYNLIQLKESNNCL